MTILRIAFVLSLISLPVSAQYGKANDQVQSMERVRTLIKSKTIAKIRVIHVPDSTLTRVSVSPETLRSIASIDKKFSDNIEGKFGPLFAGVQAKNVDHKPDLRWGVLIYDNHGREIAAVLVDKFGRYGYLNNNAVIFETGTFSSNLAKRLHKLIGDSN